MVPKHHQSYGNLGLCYAFLGKKQQALDAFDQALRINPNYEPALINRTTVEKISEGIPFLSPEKLESIDYSKDYSLKKKSLFSAIFKKISQKNEN